jgi:hypothetical protein
MVTRSIIPAQDVFLILGFVLCAIVAVCFCIGFCHVLAVALTHATTVPLLLMLAIGYAESQIEIMWKQGELS